MGDAPLTQTHQSDSAFLRLLGSVRAFVDQGLGSEIVQVFICILVGALVGLDKFALAALVGTRWTHTVVYGLVQMGGIKNSAKLALSSAGRQRIRHGMSRLRYSRCVRVIAVRVGWRRHDGSGDIDTWRLELVLRLHGHML